MAILHKLGEDFPTTEFVGGIFPRKHISIIAAKAGVGKTWYILKLITDLSKGGTIFNNQAYYEPKRNSLIFCGETGLALLNERQRMMHDKADYDKIHMVSKLEAARDKEFIDLDTKEGLSIIYKTIDTLIPDIPDIIVFDTLMSFRSIDESDQKSTTLLMSRLQALAERFNCAVILTHHLRKSSNGDTNQRIDQDEIVGSSALVRQCGNAFILRNVGFEIKQLACVKAWWEIPKAITYRMYREAGEIYFEEALADDDMTERRLELQKFLKETPQENWPSYSELGTKFKIPKATVGRICQKIVS